MNIFSNNCCGGFIYKNLIKSDYENPFIWTRINENDFLILIKEYEQINFKNYELNKLYDKLVEDEPCFVLTIDNKINCYPNHYHFNSTYTVPTQVYSHIKYNKIWEYIVEKYEERLNKMLVNKQTKPIFLLDNQNGCCKNILNEVIQICKQKYKLIVLSDDMVEKNDNELLIIQHHCDNNFPHTAVEINKDKILSFIET